MSDFFLIFCLKSDSLRVDHTVKTILYSYYKWEIGNIPLHKIRNTALWLCFQNNYFWETYTLKITDLVDVLFLKANHE